MHRCGWLRFKFAEHQVAAGQKPRLFQLRIPPGYLLFHLVPDVLHRWDGDFLKLHQEVLHKKFQRAELPLELRRIEQIDKGKHHCAVNIRVAHVSKRNNGKIRKSNEKEIAKTKR